MYRGHCRSYLRRRTGPSPRAQSGYYAHQVAAAYNFPKVTTPWDPVIAIGELGGGYVPSAVQGFFGKAGLPAPVITDLGVRGATNQPGGDADMEVLLDIVVAGLAYACCTGRPARLLVGQAPNDATGMSDLQDAFRTHPLQPAVVSWSWGADEKDYGPTGAMEAALLASSVAGMTTLAAAGDNGSSDGAGGNNVDYPASSQYTLGCGGTSLALSALGQIISEVVWNDGTQGGATGGGISTLFPPPAWQAPSLPSGTRGRGVPDWSGNADPQTGYLVPDNQGNVQVIGGTSAVAPLFAALVAVLCARAGQRLGQIAPVMYAHPEAFRDIVQGNNGGFSAGPGYDFDSGIGVPYGDRLMGALVSVPTTAPPTTTVPPTTAPPVVPPPPPVIPCPSLADAKRAVRAGLSRYVATVATPFRRLGANFARSAEPFVDAALSPLWSIPSMHEHELLSLDTLRKAHAQHQAAGGRLTILQYLQLILQLAGAVGGVLNGFPGLGGLPGLGGIPLGQGGGGGVSTTPGT